MQKNVGSARVERRGLGRPPGEVLSHCDDKGRCLYRYVAHELLVATEDIAGIAEELRAKEAEPVHAIHGMVVFRLPGADEVPDAVATLRGLSARPVVSPNHVLSPSLHDIWGAVHPAEPAAQLPPLPHGTDLPGAGVRVGVLDTGLDLHEWFRGRARRARPGDADREELSEPNDGVLDWEAGHGTHVAGIILQHAPGADVVVWGVRDENGRLDDVAANMGIVGLVRHHRVDILNLSFGGFTHDDAGSDAMRAALAEARRHNPHLVVVAAAGNREDHEHGLPPDKDPRFFPAAFEQVVSVGALNSEGQPAAFSHRGTWVTSWSLGEDLNSTFLYWNGPTALAPRDSNEPRAAGAHKSFSGFARWSGTSFAAPRVSGAIAAAMSPDGAPKGDAQRALNDVIHGRGTRIDGGGVVVNPPNFVVPDTSASGPAGVEGVPETVA